MRQTNKEPIRFSLTPTGREEAARIAPLPIRITRQGQAYLQVKQQPEQRKA